MLIKLKKINQKPRKEEVIVGEQTHAHIVARKSFCGETPLS